MEAAKWIAKMYRKVSLTLWTPMKKPPLTVQDILNASVDKPERTVRHCDG